MYCSNCGKEVLNTSKFCPNCGKIVGNNNIIKMKKISNKKLLLIILVLIVIIEVCVISLMNSDDSRVVMIYMVGSNLESQSGLATRDLYDLDYNKLSKNNTKVILIAGGTTSWKNNYIDVNETSIYSLEESGFEKINARTKNNMGSAENLSYFLNYVYDNYKASKYNFIFWNHGGGVDGSEYDDFTNDHLMLIEMADAFSQSHFKGRNKLETISFRTCLNSTIEVANIYKKYAKYLVASEEITIGSSADSALRFINDVNSDDSPIEFGKKQINVYKDVVSNTCNYSVVNQLQDENYCIKSTYSITDLSKIDDISKNLSAFSYDLNSNLSSSFKEYSKLRSNMKQYAEDVIGYDMVDLYNLSEVFNNYSQNGKKLRDSIDNAIVYNWTNTDFSHGLSIYFPYNAKLFLETYDDISTTNNYTNLITNFYNLKEGIQISSYSNFSNMEGKTNVNKNDVSDANVELALTSEQAENMAKASYLVFADTNDGYYQVIYSGKDVKLEDNKLKANIKSRLLRICDKEYSDSSSWLIGTEKEIGEDYVDLNTFFYLTNSKSIESPKLSAATAIIRIDDEHENGYIRSVYFNSESKSSSEKFSLFAPAVVKLTDYNFITVMSSRYKILDESGNYNSDWIKTSNNVIEGTRFRTNMIKLVKEDFSSEYDYYVVFRINDIANNSYYSKPIRISK